MSARILLLEDDAAFRKNLADNLDEEGFNVDAVGSALEAISACKAADYDLIVTDVRMAGMDGLECLAALKASKPAMKSIVMTGYAEEAAPGRAVQVQAEDYIYKPFKLTDLLDSINRVLQSRQEGERYSRILGPLLSAYRRVLEGLTPTDQAAISAERDWAFLAFYVGVRSKKLSQSESLFVWDELEKVEGRRTSTTSQVGAKLLEELRLSYRYILDLVTAISRSGMQHSGKPSQISPAEFVGLYSRVIAGKVSLQQLKFAPYLRRQPPEVLKASPELAWLRGQVWSDA